MSSSFRVLSRVLNKRVFKIWLTLSSELKLPIFNKIQKEFNYIEILLILLKISEIM